MALDTLFFDLKINDMTDEQIKAIKSRLEKQLGANLDIGKQIQQSVERTGSTKLKIGADTSAAEAALKRITELLSNPTGSRNEISELNALVKTLKEISSIKDKQSKSDDATNDKEILNANKLNYAYERLFNAERSMSEFAKGSQTSKSFKDAISDIQILLFYLKEARGNAQETEKVLHGIGSASNVNRALRNAEDAVKGMQKERTESEKLQNVIFSLENALKRFQTASRALGNPQGVDAAIQKLREYIELARQASKSPTSTSEFLKSNSLGAGANAKDNVSSEIALARELQRQERAAQAASAAQERLANSQQRAAQATNSHANASVRLGNSLTGLVSITGDLRNQIGMLISAYTVEHLLKNVVEIGGEFEKQKLAMGSMLGSLEQADDIFNRMKNLALTSPFNFKDLSNYSRQLTAFGTPYKDLYDTTNRLADISAGLGGDMSRLVLAFSQVKAAAYLRGQEMRQFTEFGVSLPDLLAEKYTKAEGRIVTAGDVIERVSKRMVSFNDVKDVLWQSTDKGGKFYGMQDVLAQSTSGMASNLKDAIDTMYYDIANSNSGMIKGTIKNITELISHWRELTSVLTAGTVVYGAYRMAMAIHNRWIGLNNSSTIKSVMLHQQEQAAILKKASAYRELNEREKLLVASKDSLTRASLRQLATSKAISSEDAVLIARNGQMAASQVLAERGYLNLNKSQIAYLRRLKELQNSPNPFTRFFNSQPLLRFRAGLSSVIGMVFNWQTAIFAAVGGVITLFMNYSQKKDQIAQDRLQFMKDMEDGAKTLKEFADSNPIDSIIKKGDTNEIGKAISAYKEQLQNSPIDMSSIITNADAIDNDVKKLEALRQAVIDLKNAKDAASNTGSILSGMMDKQDTVFSEPVKNNYEDMVKSFSNVSLNMSNITRGEISKTLDYLKSIPSLKNISSDFDSIKNSGDSVVGMMMRLGRMNEQTGGTIEALVKQSGNYKEVLSGIGDTRTYLDDANTFWSQIQQGLNDTAAAYRANGIDLKHTSQQNIDQYLVEANAFAQSIGLKGDDLAKYKLMVESNLDMRDTMKNHAQAWQLLFEEVKKQLIKSKTPIETASKENIIAAEKVAINNLRSGEFGAQLNSALNYISSNLNPIAIRLQIMGGNVNANTLYNDMAKRWRDKKGYMVNPPSYAMPTTEDLGQYRSDLKTNIENSKKNLDTFKKHYGEASRQYKDERERLDNYLAAQSLAGFGGDNSSSSTGGKKGHVGTGGGTNTDTFLKDMQNRLEQVKKAMDVYKKWKDTGISESESIDKMDASGIFSKGTFKNIVSENGLNDWYKKTLENLSNMVKKAKYTPERKKYTESIAELFGEFDRDETKKKLEETSKQIEDMMSETAKKWDSYKQLLESGMSKEIASSFIFGGNTQYSSKSEALADSFYNQMSEKGRYRNIGFDITEDEAKKILGDDAIGKALLSAWKMAKDEIEKERIQIQFDGQKAISQVQGIAEKIKTTLSTALDKAIRKNSTNGKETKLGDYAETGDNGLLKLKDGAEKILTDRELEMVNSYIEVTNQEITKLGSSLLELLPAWDDIFGKSAYMSLEQLLRGMREMREIIANAKVVNDKNGKPSYFTSSYKDRDGNTQTVKGNIGELNRLRNQEDTSMGELNRKNPFVGMYKSLESYFSSKKDVKYWNEISSRADKNGGTTTYTDKNGNKQKISTNDAKSKEKDAQEQASHAALSFSDAMKGAIDEMQKWNNALSLLGSTIEAVGGGTGASDAAGVAGGMLSGAASLSSLGPYGMAAGAAMGAITSIAQLHDKKLDRAIEKSKERVQELNLAYKSIEDSLKYNLGNATEGSLVNNSEIQKVKDAQANVERMKSKGKLSIFDLASLQKSEKILKESAATVKYLDENDKDNYGNAYNYQRNLYKEQLEQLKEQEQAEEDKKKPDQSKINDYNSQIQDMTTKITQFSEDLANSLYGIDIKGWASQFGDALFEAWQKGESGAEAYNETAESILQNLVKSWFKTNVIENAFKNLQKDLFGEDGQGGIFGTDNDLTQEDISKIASDIMSAQGDITSKMKKLDELSAELEKKGIDIKGNSSSSTANAISGVSEQEANIIAAYMDAIRQDTYNMRMNLLKIVEGGVKIESSPVMQAQLLQLQQIQSNTYKNMELVGDIKSLLTDFSIGNKKIYVN